MPYSDPERQRIWQRDRQRRLKGWWWEFKATLKCSRCGFSHPAAIQFHHTGDDKEATISRMVNQNLSHEDIMAEIAKCEILCANCHLIHHYETGYRPQPEVPEGDADRQCEIPFEDPLPA